MGCAKTDGGAGISPWAIVRQPLHISNGTGVTKSPPNTITEPFTNQAWDNLLTRWFCDSFFKGLWEGVLHYAFYRPPSRYQNILSSKWWLPNVPELPLRPVSVQISFNCPSIPTDYHMSESPKKKKSLFTILNLKQYTSLQPSQITPPSTGVLPTVQLFPVPTGPGFWDTVSSETLNSAARPGTLSVRL